MDGSSDLEGRVEVFVNGAWGTVCDDFWDIDDATVVCRQLGHTKASSSPGNAYFGRGSGDIVLTNVHCTGTESKLRYCPSSSVTVMCNHNEDAGVVCSNPDQYGVRLMGGSSDLEGRVEVFVDGAWGTVCDNLWDIDDARVVCRQLGYVGALSAPGSAQYGPGDGEILLADVECKGTEAKLQDCSSSLTTDKCTHLKDAGVVCDSSNIEYGSLRLVDGNSEYEGRVEIYLNGQWGTICDDGIWSKEEGDIVCKQLYGEAESETGLADFGSGSNPILLRAVDCDGLETRLDQCSYETYIGDHCTGRKSVGVRCQVPGSWSTGAIAGIVLGCLLLAALVIALVVKLYRSSRTNPTQTSSPTFVFTPRANMEHETVPPDPAQDDAPPPYSSVVAQPSNYPEVPPNMART